MYKITTRNGKDVLNPDTFCPMKKLNISLCVYYEAQHDGHGWSKQNVIDANDQMIKNIMTDLSDKVTDFVKKVNPYSCHYFEKEEIYDNWLRKYEKNKN